MRGYRITKMVVDGEEVPREQIYEMQHKAELKERRRCRAQARSKRNSPPGRRRTRRQGLLSPMTRADRDRRVLKNEKRGRTKAFIVGKQWETKQLRKRRLRARLDREDKLGPFAGYV